MSISATHKKAWADFFTYVHYIKINFFKDILKNFCWAIHATVNVRSDP